jgi:peptidoglycan L-alanyl-D-glutamate endopeptidase CwlK
MSHRTILIVVVLLCGGCARKDTTQRETRIEPRSVPTLEPEIRLPTSPPTPQSVVVDSDLTLAQALSGKEIPRAIERDLSLIEVEYLSFDGLEHRGQLVVHRDLAEEVKVIFEELKAAHFPIEKVVPVTRYGWSDESAMADNNSSAFNYRSVQGWRHLSQHAYGKAIDINPHMNPHVKNGVSQPAGAVYAPSVPGTIVAEGPVVAAFRKRGWEWGGDWRKSKDWQHFEKP